MSGENRKYQVFVSSTYEDLKEERQEIMHALLELDCIPSGMELFPAASEDQWSLIKEVIDDCDYYLVVIAGRYGSIGSEGISYTEMEYRYAASIEKPIIAFLHKDPSTISAKFTEPSDEGKKKLADFRSYAQNKMCKHWETAKELGSVVSRSLIMLQKRHPGVGWVRGDTVTEKDATDEILRLRKRIDELEEQLAESKFSAPQGTENLSQADDSVTLSCTFDSTSPEREKYTWDRSAEFTWNALFAEVSPLMLHEATQSQWQSRLAQYIGVECASRARKEPKLKGHTNLRNAQISSSTFETILIQFNALGLMAKSIKSRSVKDRGTYWTLTPYGEAMMNRLRAVTRATDG